MSGKEVLCHEEGGPAHALDVELLHFHEREPLREDGVEDVAEPIPKRPVRKADYFASLSGWWMPKQLPSVSL